MTLDELQAEIAEIHQLKGWMVSNWDVHRAFAHLHSEVSEAWTTVRKGVEPETIVDGKPEGLGAELADVVIIAFAIAAHKGVDMRAAIDQKLEHCYAKWDLMREGT